MVNPLNRRTITTVALILLVCGIALAYMMFTGKSIETHIADGDQYVTEGNHKQARREFESALAKMPAGNRDVDVLLKFVDAAKLEKVEDPAMAQRLVRQMARSYKLALDKAPQDRETFQNLMELQMYRTTVLHEFSVWHKIYVAANKMLQSSPELMSARKFRGVAHVRLLNAGLQPKGTHRHEASADLDAYLKDHPDDRETDYHLAWWHMLNADQLASEDGVPEEQIAEARSRSLARTEAARERWPQWVQGHLQHATMLLSTGKTDQARAIVLEQERKLLKDPGTAQNMLTLTDLISRVEPDETPDQRDPTLNRIASACEAAHKSQPDELLFEVIRARVLARTGAVDESLQILEDIRQRPVNAVPLEATRLFYAQTLALIDHANLLLDRAEQEVDPTRNQETIAQLDGLMESVKVLLGESIPGLTIAGRSAALRGRWSEAVQHFGSANKEFGGRNLGLQSRLADALDKVGQSEEAIPILENLLTNDRLTAPRQVRYQLAQILINSRKFKDARRHIEVLKRDDPDDERVAAMQSVLANNWMTLANAQRESGDLDAALESALSTVDLLPQDSAAIRLLAAVHGDRGEHKDALKHMYRVHDLLPDNAPIRNQYAQYEQRFGSKLVALERRQQWAEKYPDDAGNRRSLIQLLGHLGKHDEARRTLEELIRDHGKDLSNTILAARVEAAAGDVDAGRDILEQYVQDREDAANVDEWIGLAHYLAEHKGMDTAIVAYEQARAVDDSPTKYATRVLAARLESSGQPDKAEPLYRQLYESFPVDHQIAEGFARLLIFLGNADEARDVVQNIIRTSGASTSTYLFEADLATMAGNLDEAVARLEQASMLSPRDGRIHFHIGRMLAGVGGRGARAKQALRRAIELNSSLLDAREILAMELLKDGDIDAAIEELEFVVRQDPTQVEALDQLGDLYVRTDRIEEARKLLEESARLFPDDSRWPRLLAQLARRQANRSESSLHLKRIFELDPSPTTLGSAAVELNKAGQFDESLSLMGQHSEFLEADPLLHAVRGWSLARLGRSTEAHDAYGTALAGCKTYQQIDRVNKHLHSGLGAEKAQALLEKARDAENDVLVSLAIADLEIRTGNAESAITRLNKIESQLQQYSPNRLPTERALAMALHQTKQGKMAAHKIYQEILKKAPRDVAALCGLAWILAEVPGRADQAFKFADAAVRADPDSARAQATMGWVLFRQGNVDKSVMTLRHALQLERSSPHCLYLGRVLMGSSDEASVDEALKLLNESAQLAAEAGEIPIEERARMLIEKLTSQAAQDPAAPAP